MRRFGLVELTTRQTHVGYENAASCQLKLSNAKGDLLCTCLRHLPRISVVENIWRGQHVELMGHLNHIDLEIKSHAGLLQVLSERAIDQPVVARLALSHATKVL